MGLSRKIFLSAVFAVFASVASSAWAEPDGAEVFELCVQCHGSAGQGSRLALAPSIAGLPDWYVKAQLHKFRSGIRGMHPDDVAGLRMYPMSLALKQDAEIDAVAAHVASLPRTLPAPEVEGGDPERGKSLYAPCTACHGAEGQGNPALNGPPLVGINDWYGLRQLQNFKAGIRGANPKDETGKLMQAMSMTLADEQAMKDIVAYLATLPGK